LIIFDEAHRSVARTYKRAIDLLLFKGSLLGLSATPGRSYYGQDDKENEGLVDLFKGQKVVLKIPPYSSPIEALIKEGYLAKLEKRKLDVVNDTLSVKELQRIREVLAEALDLDEASLCSIAMDATRNLQILECVEKLIRDEGHQRIIVFAPTVESSDLMANLLRARGLKESYSVTSRTPHERRRDWVNRYKTPSANPVVLFNFGVLSTGFDAPKTSAVVIARPTKSIVLLNQMAGRAIRGPRVEGTESAVLVTVVDTSIPELVETINQFHAFDTAWADSQTER
jgi:superfamily II DNA or RNA helicase